MSAVQGDVVRIDLIGDIDSVDEIVGTYQAKLTSPIALTSDEVMNDWAEIFGNLWDLIKAIHHTLVVFRKITGHNLTTNELQGTRVWGTPLTGTATGDPLPNQATIPVTFKTTVPKVLLRKLWGPAAEGNTGADGTYGALAVEDALDGAAFMLDTLIGLDGIWQYGYNSPKTLQFEEPITAQVTNIPGSIRRRRRGSGS